MSQDSVSVKKEDLLEMHKSSEWDAIDSEEGLQARLDNIRDTLRFIMHDTGVRRDPDITQNDEGILKIKAKRGDVLTPDSIDKYEFSETDEFQAELEDTAEMHIVHPQDIMNGFPSIWPCADREGNYIKLQSAFGWGNPVVEDYILVRKARVV